MDPVELITRWAAAKAAADDLMAGLGRLDKAGRRYNSQPPIPSLPPARRERGGVDLFIHVRLGTYISFASRS